MTIASSPMDDYRHLPEDKRMAWLQKHIGPRVDLDKPDAKHELHRRALLVSQIKEEGLWPK